MCRLRIHSYHTDDDIIITPQVSHLYLTPLHRLMERMKGGDQASNMLYA